MLISRLKRLFFIAFLAIKPPALDLMGLIKRVILFEFKASQANHYLRSEYLNSSFICLMAFCFGVSVLLVSDNIAEWLTLGGLLFCSIGLVIRFDFAKPILFATLGFVWASGHAHFALSNALPKHVESVNIEIQGRVLGLPVQNGNDYRFRFKINEVTDSKLSKLVGQKIQLSCYRCPMNFAAGQRWYLTVRLKRPHGYASWGAFDYEKYLFRHRLVAKGYVRLKGENTRLNDQDENAAVWRETIRRDVRQKMPNSVGRNIILALTIGDKSGFTKRQLTVFQNSGVSHLMAISGLHIGLVFMSVMVILRGVLWPFARVYNIVPRPHLLLFPAFFTAYFYASLAGFAVSTQRALTMLLVFLVCRLLARQIKLAHVLVLAASILLIIDPFSILDIGFWLSCGAVFIIAVFSRNDTRTSLVSLQPVLWLGMLPMSVVFFGKLSFVSPLVNLLLVPLFCLVLIPITLLLMALSLMGLTTIGDYFLPILAEVFGYIYLLLSVISDWPYAGFFTTPLLWWQWGLFMGGALFLWLRHYKAVGVVSVLLLTSMVFQPKVTLKHDELRLVLLDVGQGLAMVIETSSSTSVYDTGPRYSSGFTAAEAVLIPYLRRRGVTKINNLIISHADNDHIGGYQKVQAAFPIDRVFSSRVDKLPESILCQEGQFWQSDTTVFSIIGPNKNTPSGSNNLSCVLKIEHQGVTVLLTGDIEKQVERYMLNSSDDLTADILLVPHQGSKTSSTAEFLDAVSPSVALLAAGYKNHYGHPHASVIERYEQRGIKVFSTIESGSMLLKINAHSWSLIGYRQSERRFWFD